jgi:hypothetical protein
MANANVVQPRLQSAPAEYDQVWMNNLVSQLRLYFTQIDNAGPMVAASSNIGTTSVKSGLNFSHPNPSNPNKFVSSLPTQADLSNLRSGDIYYDTSANNVLKIKP